MGEWPLLKVKPSRRDRLEECRGVVEACPEELLGAEELPVDCVVVVRGCEGAEGG